ncbi:signal peptidase I [Caulobacter mirabilis]|uniref:Signal peptidase I n=1 Tax=Caulobacter mirabilis TaxID=69666 RepID=A0A2D2AXM5_9CAUL|nr:signal peptidase I [Caulobacter mirabilis]ATQ42742.1 signal peptidase I [Caulobacter mirabilis]
MNQADKPNGAREETVETIKSLGVILLIVLVLRIFLFQPFTIPSSSMKPNLLIGDYIVVSKFSYGFSRHSIPFSPPLFKGRIFGSAPKRGDVVVFKTPANNRTDLIKRVVGLPGDSIQVTDGVLSINGKALPRVADGQGNPDACANGATPTRFIETNPIGKRYETYDCGPDGALDNTPVYVVPEGHYFMMGDNRDNSADSRVPPEVGGVGFVPAENLVGKAQIILASWENVSLFKPWTWFLNLRGDRFVHPIK